MKSKSLKTIQVLSKIGMILSKTTFVCCIIGFCGCIAGMISLAAGFEAIKIGGVTINGILQAEADVTTGTLYATMAVGMALSAGEAVVAEFAERYFKRELNDGTPFDLGGAKQMLNLGIITISVSIGSQILAAIIYAIFKATMEGVAPFDFGSAGSAAIGIMFIVTSLICRYGAELTNPNVEVVADVKETAVDPFEEDKK